MKKKSKTPCPILVGKILTMTQIIMASLNENIFRITGPLWGEPVTSPHKGQWRGALMFSLICAWKNDWANNGDARDLSHRAHYDVTVIWQNHLVPASPNECKNLAYTGFLIITMVWFNHNIDGNYHYDTGWTAATFERLIISRIHSTYLTITHCCVIAKVHELCFANLVAPYRLSIK